MSGNPTFRGQIGNAGSELPIRGDAPSQHDRPDVLAQRSAKKLLCKGRRDDRLKRRAHIGEPSSGWGSLAPEVRGHARLQPREAELEGPVVPHRTREGDRACITLRSKRVDLGSAGIA